MKRLFVALILAIAVLGSCDNVSLAPEFSRSVMPYEVPAAGGEYQVKVDYRETRATYHYLEWEFRTIVDGVVIDQVNIPACNLLDYLTDDCFIVRIPANKTGHLRPIIVESSYYVEHGQSYTDSDGGTYSTGGWTDWFPICSSVQLANF